jgi:pimeloyl-ACP methyl ester carboxylesterase
MEVWVLQRRGAHLADTSALIAARKAKNPSVALKYYYGTPLTGPGPGPGAPARILAPGPDAGFKVLTQTDLGFMADWGFQAYAGDVDAMIGLIRTRSGARNIFLAGHSQGGSFVANYAARLQPDGQRGVDIGQVGGVLRVQERCLRQDAKADVLVLMAITFEPDQVPGGAVVLKFAGGGDLRVAVETIDIVLADISLAWPVAQRPRHTEG